MGGGDAERDNEEGMSLHKILGRSGIMRRGAEWDRRCNEILKISRKSRLAVPLKSTLHLQLRQPHRFGITLNVESCDGDAAATQVIFKHALSPMRPHLHENQLLREVPPALWATRWFRGSFNQIN